MVLITELFTRRHHSERLLFKLWTYQSARTIEAGGNRAQQPTLHYQPCRRPYADRLELTGQYLFRSKLCCAANVIAGLLIRTNRVDDGFRKRLRQLVTRADWMKTCSGI